MSELDNLSDSDWLDIASGRESDDNDSLSEEESDHDEISTQSRSRRSSISNDGSISSEVEAWEGFVSDSGEEPGAVTGMYPVPLPSPFGAEPIALGDIAATVDITIDEEEQRVKEALDQSLVGTLSASRSSTAAHFSTPNSIRDLRLSFPDPLTSSRNDLNRSYETVPSPTDSTVSSSTDDTNTLELAPPAVVSPPLEDPGLSITPVVQHQHQEAQLSQHKAAAPLEIFLYGSPSEIKWKFLHELIEKAAMISGYDLCNGFRESGQTRSISLSKRSEGSAPFFNVINASDRTADSDSAILEVGVNDSSERPSLAIVYLPAAKLPELLWHSRYLPVLVPSVNNVDRDLAMRTAEDDWDLLAVPPNRVLNLRNGKSHILDADELSKVDSTSVYEALRNVGRDNKVITLKPLAEQVKSVNAVTLFALVSIIMGFAFNASFRPTPAPTRTINPPSSGFVHNWSFFTAQPNRSILAPCTGTQSLKSSSGDTTLTTTPSIEDTSLSVFNPGSTSLSIASPSSAKSLSIPSTSNSVAELTTTSPKQKCHQCGPKPTPSAEKPSTSTDIMLRSTVATALTPSIYARPSGSIMASPSSGSASTILLAGTDRVAGIPKSTVASVASAAAGISLQSVTEALDATTKALADVVGSDLAELAETADELLMTLREQRDNVIRQSKGKARAFGEQIQNVNELVVNRNERAKKRARELKKRGEDIVREASKELRERTEYARRRAKALKKRVVDGGTEAWKTYEKPQAEWEATLSSLKQRPSTDENENPGARTARGCAKKNSRSQRSLNVNRKMKMASADICV